MSVRVAIVGATGAVGQTLLKVLAERSFPASEVRLLASARSAGRTVEFQGEQLTIAEAEPKAFEGIEYAFFCASGEIARSLGPEAVARGAVVIDNSSAFRMDDSVPLIVPEINAKALNNHQGIIANPNCSTIIMVVALKPLYDAVGIKRIVVSTYQAASGAGVEAVEELKQQVEAFSAGRPMEARILPSAAAKKHYPLAFNVIPQVDLFGKDGYTKEEWKMVFETHKIFNDHSIMISPTAVRVPVMWCHSESINVETYKPLSAVDARQLLSRGQGIIVIDDIEEQLYPMPIDFPDRDEVFVGRIRGDISAPNALNLWVVGNQLRKGAATNAVQIAEVLLG
ncbi:MAG: asd [Bacillota bacterium]|nr:MAG: asd [Bacillota bacterium]